VGEKFPEDPAKTPAMQAMVRYNGSGYHLHRIHEISVDGAFVEFGNVRVLRPDATVQLVFVHRHRGRSETHLLKGHVRDIATNGARIEFSDIDHPAQRALKDMDGTGRES
jgi:hypothetical protein